MDDLLNLNGYSKLVKAINKEAKKTKEKEQLKNIMQLVKRLEPLEKKIKQLLDINMNNQVSEKKFVYMQTDSLYDKLVILSAEELVLRDKIYKVNLKNLDDLANRIDLCLIKILDIEKAAKEMG